jgi:iron complex transport system permease protein
MRQGETTAQRAIAVLGASFLVLLIVIAASLYLGAVHLTPSEVVGVLARKIGWSVGPEPSVRAQAVVWQIRAPRITMGFITGVVLALSGAALQGLFRNQMADPHLLGIGPGAAIGGALGTLLGGAQGAIAGAVVAGILTSLVLRGLIETRETERSRFILMGVALGLALSAWVGFAVFAGDRTKVPPVEFWLLGGFSSSTWVMAGRAAIFAAVGVAVIVAGRRTLDVLALGEAEARHLGVDVDLYTSLLLIAVGAAVGAVVGASGVIVFVGLLVPHVVRRMLGPRHGMLFAGCAVVGPLFVIGADLGARTLFSPVEIPVGLVTAAIAGPFFLWLARRDTGLVT